MTDVALQIVTDQFVSDLAADIALFGADLATDDGLNTAIIISLFSDARADDDDALPVPGGDRRGWWGDAYAEIAGDITGSKLWLLERSKQTSDVLVRAQQYAQDALAWLIADGVASAVEVTTLFPQRGWLEVDVVVTRPTGPSRDRFDYVWKNP